MKIKLNSAQIKLELGLSLAIPKIGVSLSCSAKLLVTRNMLGPIAAYLGCSAKPLVARNMLGPKNGPRGANILFDSLPRMKLFFNISINLSLVISTTKLPFKLIQRYCEGMCIGFTAIILAR